MKKSTILLAAFLVTFTAIGFIYMFSQVPAAGSAEYERQLIESIYGSPLK